MNGLDDPPRGPTREFLIVEDDDDFVHDVAAASEVLPGERIRWSRARTIDDAFEYIASDEQKSPDLAIVDVRLGSESGIDFVKRARENSYAFPILLVSQSDLKDIEYNGHRITRKSLSSIGVNNFFSKTQISSDQIEFLTSALLLADNFDYLFELADHPDRVFHGYISTDNLRDCSTILDSCRTLELVYKSWEFNAGDSIKQETARTAILAALDAAKYLKAKEELRLSYSRYMSTRDKLKVFHSGMLSRRGRFYERPEPNFGMRRDSGQSFSKSIEGVIKATSRLLFPSVFKVQGGRHATD